MTEASSFLEAYFAPINDLLENREIVEIAINSDGAVWIEKQGAPYMALHLPHKFQKTEATNIGSAIASDIGAQFSAAKPILSGKIDYHGRPLRAQVIAEPAIDGGTVVTLRSYSQTKISLGQTSLLHGGLVDLEAKRRERAQHVAELAQDGKIEDAMRVCVEDRLNILISGGTSSGKTTFARGLLELVEPQERIVTIEDAFELFPEQPNSVYLRAKRVDGGEVTAAKLLEATLRLRPDRIILGELRGSECKTFLDAINTGHGGSFTTIHADTAKKALDRLALMVMDVGMNMTFQEVWRYCANSIDLVVQLGRHDGRRGVAEIFLPALHIPQ